MGEAAGSIEADAVPGAEEFLYSAADGGHASECTETPRPAAGKTQRAALEESHASSARQEGRIKHDYNTDADDERCTTAASLTAPH